MRTHGLSLDEWLAQIETYSPQEIDLGLERVDTLLQRLDLVLPETVFHVAGTNGKGSSAAMLDALLRSIGARVGCYTSPHLLRYNERIRLDGAEATDAQIVAAFELIESVRGDVPLTYFEFGTLAAMAVFATADIEIAVLEVGMGALLRRLSWQRSQRARRKVRRARMEMHSVPEEEVRREIEQAGGRLVTIDHPAAEDGVKSSRYWVTH